MMRLTILGILALVSCSAGANKGDDKRDNGPEKKSSGIPEFVEVMGMDDTVSYTFVDPSKITDERWDALAHPNFWKDVMCTPQDTAIINIAKTREVVCRMAVKDWNAKSESQKGAYRDSVRKAHGLNADDKVYMTTGKAHYYELEGMIPLIDRAIDIFRKEGVDPFFAQAILLIESPGIDRRSHVGAQGAFQLMPSVARKYGLRVDKYVDERKDFDKAARTAARFLKLTMIPETKRIFDERGMDYDEAATWFRLVVLHCYHAGPGNVRGVINVINPTEGGQELIAKMWVNSYKGFQNASQNYSQLALAAMLRLNEHIYTRCQSLEHCDE